MKIRTAALATAVALGLAIAPARAQNEDVSEVVVTAARLTEYDPIKTPYVSLKKRPDNLITVVRVLCDTRDLSQRRNELKATLRNMIKAAPAAGVELGLGEEIIGRFDESMLDSVIRPDSRPDTSQAVLVIKTRISPTDTFDAATGRIMAFADKTPTVGRAEIVPSEDWDLTLIGPQKHRGEVIALVAEDARRASAAFGPQYAVSVEGLQLPVSWYQSGPLELALYIPYRMTVLPKGTQ
ncbi:hypothetical protein DMC25_13260 [Caulobacter sp. D4A]|uniref:hypothetical protein n=1 Tax=unclassified Caulobacter TaxID=2648921 RepID=UPI000D73D60F|nr:MULTISPECIES: hypothetical protein [unclassified Caulobacter]PXA86830.1 hypothetical protein DMC25_13260 [Caulobacter sp. D4A]PXA91436.1 hypothetical protein DMC18_13265 [Caulobacter sp. D5]